MSVDASGPDVKPEPEHFGRSHVEYLLACDAPAESHCESPGLESCTELTYVGSERGSPVEVSYGSDVTVAGLMSLDAYILDESTESVLVECPHESSTDASKCSVVQRPCQ